MIDPTVLRAQAERMLAAHPYIGAELEPMMALIADCPQKRLAPDEALCAEGERGDALYFLLRGRIQVSKRGRSGKPLAITTLTAPALLGHMSVIDGAPRSATCVASERSLVGVMSVARYRELIDRLDDLGLTLRRLMLSSLNQQLLAGNRHIHDLLAPPAIEALPEPLPARPDTPRYAGPRPTPAGPAAVQIPVEDPAEAAQRDADAQAVQDLLEHPDALDAALLRAAATLEGWESAPHATISLDDATLKDSDAP